MEMRVMLIVELCVMLVVSLDSVASKITTVSTVVATAAAAFQIFVRIINWIGEKPMMIVEEFVRPVVWGKLAELIAIASRVVVKLKLFHA